MEKKKDDNDKQEELEKGELGSEIRAAHDSAFTYTKYWLILTHL